MAYCHRNAPGGYAAGGLARKSEGNNDDKSDKHQKNELVEKLRERDEEIKQWVEKAQEEAKTAGEMSQETKSALEKLAGEGNEMQERLTELEQKLARKGEKREPAKSWGQAVVEHDSGKSLLSGHASRTGKISVKTVTSAAGSGADLVVTDRLPGIIAPPDRPMTIRDLIMPGTTGSNSVEYVRETGFINNAAPVAENTLKPESDLSFDLETANVRTIAHWLPATKQILDDAPQLRSYIDGRLRYGLEYVEEQQILTGDGTGQNLDGLIPNATAFDNSLRVAGEPDVDVVRHAMLQVRLAEYRASGIVMHPADWERIELTKVGAEDNRYLFANPTATAQPRLWGVPVVETMAMAEGEFLVGAFNMAAQLFDRETTTVEVSTEDRDNFVKNMVTVRAEERLAMAVYRPQSFITGSFEAPAP